MTAPTIAIIPCAGASAASYRRMRSFLGERYETRVFELPGRGSRWRERPVSSWQEAKLDLRRWLPRGRRLVIFGHSFGAYLGMGALIGCLAEERIQCDQLIIASNCPPSHATRYMGPSRLLSRSSDVLAVAKRFGSADIDFPADPLLRARAIEALRADFLLAYEAISDLAPKIPANVLDVQASILLGKADPTGDFSSAEWSPYFLGGVTTETIPSVGHFFPILNPALAAETAFAKIGSI